MKVQKRAESQGNSNGYEIKRTHDLKIDRNSAPLNLAFAKD